MHRDLLRLRHDELALKPRNERWYDGAALGEQAFFLRYFGPADADDRLLIINLGPDHEPHRLPVPLLAPPDEMQWAVRWSSEDIEYGGAGTPELAMDQRWRILGEAALWLAPARVPTELTR